MHIVRGSLGKCKCRNIKSSVCPSRASGWRIVRSMMLSFLPSDQDPSFSVETQTMTGFQREGRVSGGKCVLSRFKLCLERSLQHSDVGKAVRETNSCPQVKFNPPTQTLSAIKANMSKAIFLTHVAIFLY